MRYAMMIIVAASLFLFVDRASAQTTWTGTAGDGQWTTAGNWSPATVPPAGASIVIPAGHTVIFHPGAGVTHTILDFDIASNSFLDLFSGELVVQGTSSSSGQGGLTVLDGATLTFNTHPNPAISAALWVTDGGTLNIEKELQIVSPPAVNPVIGGTVNFTTSAAIMTTVWNNWIFAPTSVNGEAKFQTVGSAWVTINYPTVHTLHLNGGTVTSSGTVEITDTLDWENGRFWAGTWDINAATTVMIHSNATKNIFSGTINFNVPVTMTDTGNMTNGDGAPVLNFNDTFTCIGPGMIIGGSGSTAGRSIMNITSNGILDMQDLPGSIDQVILNIDVGGIARLGATAGQTVVGTVTVNGTLVSHGTLTLSGATTIGVGGSIIPLEGTSPVLLFPGGSLNLNTTTLSGFDQIDMTNDLTLNISGDCLIDDPALLDLYGLAFSGTGSSLTCSNDIVINGINTIWGSGKFITESAVTKTTSQQIMPRNSSVWEIAGPVMIDAACTIYLREDGRVDVLDGGSIELAGSIAVSVEDNDGIDEKLTIHPGGALKLFGSSALTLNSVPLIIDGGLLNLQQLSTLTATGTTTIDQDSGTTRLGPGSDIAMNGTNPFRLHGGVLRGIGGISGAGLMQDGGVIRPGPSNSDQGTLTISGDYTQVVAAGSPPGRLQIDIFDLGSAPDSCDQLIVTGMATLAENVVPRLRYHVPTLPPTLPADVRWTIIDGSHTGMFTNIGDRCEDQFVADYDDPGFVELIYTTDCTPFAPMYASVLTPSISEPSVAAIWETVSEVLVAGTDGSDAAIWTDTGAGLVETLLPGLGGASSASADVGADSISDAIYSLSVVGCADDGAGLKPARWNRDSGGVWTVEELPGGTIPGGEATTIGLTPAEPTGDLIGGWVRDAGGDPQAAIWSRSSDVSPSWQLDQLPKADPLAQSVVTDLSRGDPDYASGVETLGVNSTAVIWIRDGNGDWNVEALANYPGAPGGGNASANTIFAGDLDGVMQILVEGWADDGAGLQQAARWENDGFGWTGPNFISDVLTSVDAYVNTNTGGSRILGDEINNILGDEINNITGEQPNDFKRVGSITTVSETNATAWIGKSNPIAVNLNDFVDPAIQLTNAVTVGRNGTIIANGVQTSPTARGGTVPVSLLLTPIVCDGDLDGNGAVDVVDLLALLAAWNTPAADIDGNGNTDVLDLLALLAAWGACP